MNTSDKSILLQCKLEEAIRDRDAALFAVKITTVEMILIALFWFVFG